MCPSIMNGMNVDQETDKCNLLDADALGSVISHKAKRCGRGIRREREETHTKKTVVQDKRKRRPLELT